MPTKRARKSHDRVRFGLLEQFHLLRGDCGMGPGCGLCRVEHHPHTPCPRPLKLALAARVWGERRRELLAQWDAPKAHGYSERKSGELYGWGHLRPRIPSFAEIWFDAVPLPPQPDPSWPEPARCCWYLLGLRLARLRMYVADDDETYRKAQAQFRALRDMEIGDE
jgi:hypothetical protein